MNDSASAGLPVRVFLRPIGTPIPLGLAGLAIASLVQSGLNLGWVASSETAQVGLILLVVPMALQLLAAIFSYLARDSAAGTAFGVLATGWAAQGLMHLVRGSHISGSLGLMMLTAAAMLALSAITTVRAKLLPATTMLLAALHFSLGGVYQLGAGTGWEHAAGIAGVVLTAAAGYGVLALELEGQAGHPILPTLRRGRGEAAVAAGPADQVEHVEHEAGVRKTT